MTPITSKTLALLDVVHENEYAETYLELFREIEKHRVARGWIWKQGKIVKASTREYGT